MIIKKLETLEEFKNLNQGDTILVRWGEYGKAMKPVMVYEIPKVQHKENEIICNIKNNHYFNYKMHLGLDTFGRCTSNAKEVYLVETE